jgi:hypothetical protein
MLQGDFFIMLRTSRLERHFEAWILTATSLLCALVPRFTQIANSLVCGDVTSSVSVLLKRGNAFSSDATLGDPKRVEEAETVKVTPPSPDKVTGSWKI